MMKDYHRRHDPRVHHLHPHLLSSIQVFFLSLCLVIVCCSTSDAKVTFEKMTNRDYPGSTYYTIRNVSLYECLGWCRDEVDCSAASFSFVVNPLAPMQETTCRLQNETTTGVIGHKTTSSSHSSSSSSSNSVSNPQKAVNLYYFSKTNLRSDNVCNRLWSFEKYPNKVLRGLDNAIIYTSNKEACLSSCLNEVRFVCRSVEFNYVTLQCHLSEYDRRSPGAFPVDLVDTQGVDYFENSCLQCEYRYILPSIRTKGSTFSVCGYSLFLGDSIAIFVHRRLDCTTFLLLSCASCRAIDSSRTRIFLRCCIWWLSVDDESLSPSIYWSRPKIFLGWDSIW